MQVTRYGVRSHPAIQARQRHITKQKKAERRENIKNIMLVVLFFGCIIASGYCN